MSTDQTSSAGGACSLGGRGCSSPLSAALPTVLRVALGSIFVFSGVMKVGRDLGLGADTMAPVDFYASINAFKLGLGHDVTSALAYAIPWVEIVAGAALLLGLAARGAAAIVAVLMLAFGVGIARVLVNGYDASCTCFGKIGLFCGPTIGPCHLVRNAGLMGIALVIVAMGPGMLALGNLWPARACAKKGG